jgi:hypothetical protein
MSGSSGDKLALFSKRDRTLFSELIRMISTGGFPMPSGPLSLLGVVFSIVTWLFLRSPFHTKGKITKTEEQKEENLFIMPLPAPVKDDTLRTSPKLYRPFRHGPNFITMGIRKLSWDNWIEMDSYFLRYHAMKASELKKDFNAHVKYVDNAMTRDACFELYEELVRYLTHRYPKVYRLEGGKVYNSLTKENFPFPACMAGLILYLRRDL